MNTGIRVLAVLMVVAGAIILALGGNFTFTETHDVGPFIVREREGVNIPLWGGVGLIAAGVGVFLVTLMPSTRRTT
jgi:hypothetical protein